jgi:hypothetical protein
MEQSLSEKLYRGCCLISAPYSPYAYYTVIVIYGLLLTAGFYRYVVA